MSTTTRKCFALLECLAGDYTAGEYPATIEAAVRSGLRCAELATAHLCARPPD